MLLYRTISQLDIGDVPPARAKELGQLGYMQWLGALPAIADYSEEAKRAYVLASPFRCGSPAIAVFCDLLIASTCMPIAPLPLSMPEPKRRGGAEARRGVVRS